MPTREITVIIASPSDASEERDAILHKIETMFRREGFEELCNARIIVEGWESIPSQPGYAQDIINSDLIKGADIVCAVFKHKLGTPTINTETGEQRALSGTAEELMQALSGNKKPLGMAYFYEFPPEPLNPNSEQECARLEACKKDIRNKMLDKLYNNDLEKLLRMICREICNHIRKHKLFSVG
ncbi:hypothetical protein BH10BAC4_BH10BAC4_05610 [soil metagenome]